MEREKRKRVRTVKTYQNKLDKITRWYNKLKKNREENPNPINKKTKKPIIRKTLKSLDWYLEKLKKPVGEKK